MYVILSEMRNERSRRIPRPATKYLETLGDSSVASSFRMTSKIKTTLSSHHIPPYPRLPQSKHPPERVRHDRPGVPKNRQPSKQFRQCPRQRCRSPQHNWKYACHRSQVTAPSAISIPPVFHLFAWRRLCLLLCQVSLEKSP